MSQLWTRYLEALLYGSKSLLMSGRNKNITKTAKSSEKPKVRHFHGPVKIASSYLKKSI